MGPKFFLPFVIFSFPAVLVFDVCVGREPLSLVLKAQWADAFVNQRLLFLGTEAQARTFASTPLNLLVAHDLSRHISSFTWEAVARELQG